MSKPFGLEEMKARYKVFQKYVLEDQKHYYRWSMIRFDQADEEVTRIRGWVAFATGLSSATAGLIVQTQFSGSGQCADLIEASLTCTSLQYFVIVLVILSVILPPIGVFFSTLADTFGWSTLRPLYERSLENMIVADALSPDEEMTEDDYWAGLSAYVKGTLAVMKEETTRFELKSKTPDELRAFIEEQRKIAARVGGDAERHES